MLGGGRSGDKREMMPNKKQLEFLDRDPLVDGTVSSDRTDFEF